ncbi:unnamed protein product, partial [Amoebophrya sp. A25]|eukprot:GSA25T00010596001.1
MPPRKVMNIAEKPSVQRGITQHLARGVNINRRRVGQGNNGVNVDEFMYTINGEQVEMKVSAVRGHLMQIDFPENCRSWQGVPPETLYSQPIRKFVPNDMLPLKRMIETLAGECQVIVLWLDCDREGEAIGFEVLEVALGRNPRLMVKRAVFSALTHQDITRAVQNLRDPNRNLSDAVEARTEVDLRIGASFTRFMCLRYQRRFPDLARQLLSYGPCQFPTLGFVVKRYQEIRNFIPEPFWGIKLQVDASTVLQQQPGGGRGIFVPAPGFSGGPGGLYGGLHHGASTNTSYGGQTAGGATAMTPAATTTPPLVVDFTWQRGRLFDRLAVLNFFEECVANRENVVVTSTDTREVSHWRPIPLATIELTKKCSTYFGIPSSQTMKLAEELYQAGFISYPRTETEKFHPSINLRDLAQEHMNHAAWGGYVQNVLFGAGGGGGTFQNARQGQKDDQAHPPIHPVKSLSEGEQGVAGRKWSVYELIARHFLACVSADAKGEKNEVQVNCGDEIFTASGLRVTQRGFLEVYPYDRWGRNDTMLPPFAVGEVRRASQLEMTSGTTQPPELLTEAELIGLMDKNEIGTDATMATHIQTIQDRSYSTLNADRRFAPTTLGLALVEGYQDFATLVSGYDISRPQLRATMESEMDQIARGNKAKADFLQQCLAHMHRLFVQVNQQPQTLDSRLGSYFPDVMGNYAAGGGGPNGPGGGAPGGPGGGGPGGGGPGGGGPGGGGPGGGGPGGGGP